MLAALYCILGALLSGFDDVMFGAPLGKVRNTPGPVRGDIVDWVDCSSRKLGRVRMGRCVILFVVTCVLFLEEHVAFQPWLFYMMTIVE